VQIRTRLGVSLDGFVSGPDGRPALLAMPDFVPGESHGYPEFAAECSAVVMGRNTFEPALGSPDWPWPGLQVYVLSSEPLPEGTPEDVIAASEGPERLLEQLRGDDLDGDVHLLGGPRTIDSFLRLGAVDRLEVLVLPLLLGDGLALSPPGAPRRRLRLEDQQEFPDGALLLSYAAD
jgi:dihydrofolate reductase